MYQLKGDCTLAQEMTLDQFMEKTASGQLFTVDFVKRGDGSIRTMNCRRGVSKGVKGVGQAYKPSDHNLLTVYDMQKLDPSAAHNKGKTQEEMQKGAFRNVNLDALVGLRMNGRSYNWNHTKKVFVES